ncbi:Bcl-2-modifying factor [Manis javanica]|nr:Bcl-2-modifying factor [Manis javanica]
MVPINRMSAAQAAPAFLISPLLKLDAAAAAPACASRLPLRPAGLSPSFPIESGRQAPECWSRWTLARSPGITTRRLRLSPGVTQGRWSRPSSQLDCPLSRLQLFPLTHCCGPGLRPASQEDKATQTLSPASPSQGVMLPCGVTEEPQRLFYGNAGYRLPLPAGFPAVLPFGEQSPEGQWQHRAEVQIARKLQCIADQFHRLHMQQHQQNRNRVWWQILLFLHNLALNADENRNGAGPR